MGYYLHLVQKNGSCSLSADLVVERLRGLGASVSSDDDAPKSDQYFDLYYPGIQYPITVRRLAAYDPLAMCAYIRVSWAERLEGLKELLHKLLDLADRAGFTVHDPQQQVSVIPENIDQIAEDFVHAASNVRRLLG